MKEKEQKNTEFPLRAKRILLATTDNPMYAAPLENALMTVQAVVSKKRPLDLSAKDHPKYPEGGAVYVRDEGFDGFVIHVTNKAEKELALRVWEYGIPVVILKRAQIFAKVETYGIGTTPEDWQFIEEKGIPVIEKSSIVTLSGIKSFNNEIINSLTHLLAESA